MNSYETFAYVTKAPEGSIDYKKIKINSEIGDVLLKPILTGICGTDRGIVNGALSFAYNPGGYDFLVIGHESLCKVVESSDKNFKAGDLVVPVVRRPGDCPNCRIGRPDNCSDGNKHEAGITGLHGFMRGQFYEQSINLVKVEDPSLKDVAVLTEPTKNVEKAMEVLDRVSSRSIYSSGDSTFLDKNCIIIGTGNEAFLYGLSAKDRGFNTYMVNRHPLQKNITEMLDAFGINFIDTSQDKDFNKRIKADLLIDTSGDPGTIFNYIREMNYNGIAILFGTNGKAPSTQVSSEDIDHIIERNITIAGSVDAAKTHYVKALDDLSKWNRRYGTVFSSMISNRISPGDTEIFFKKANGEIKSVIEWE